MTARVTPYLSFADQAREAMTFYQSIFKGTLDFTTWADLNRTERPDQEKLIAHSVLTGATGLLLMASDTGDPVAAPVSRRCSVVLGGDETELTAYWGRLSEGGTVLVPYARSAWGALHGQCLDAFGTSWLLNATADA